MEAGKVTVRLPRQLLDRPGRKPLIEVCGGTVRDVIHALEVECPGMLFHVCYETGELRPFVNIFLGREDVRYMQGLDTPVADGATMHIIHSVAGG